jgi:diguanylate cyclase (GGDEF)-like protein
VLIALAILASLVTVALLISVLRAVLRHEPPPAPKTRVRHERRRAHPAARDAREAIALVGDALAATHNPRALVPLILEVVTEATGARGAQMMHGGAEVGWFGEAGGRTRPLTLDLASEDSDADTKLLLYPPAGGFDVETKKLAEWVAAQAGIALENARLHEEVRRQATTDELTNLVNRRRFIEALETELERARMFDSPLSVVLADLDDFKRINDEYGHHGGDRALTSFGELLRSQVRDFDVAARLGGEEFAILLPQTTAEAAAVVASRTRDMLAASPMAVSEQASVRLTASFGVAESAPGQTSDQLLRRADEALYAAKRAGKNRYVVDSPAELSRESV